MEKTFEVIFPF